MIEVSTDKSRLDVPLIHNIITNLYWSKGRTIAEVQTTINHSVCFGIYLDNVQVGFARIVTDYTVFAYLMDVFIVEEHRGKGYSSLLMEVVMNEPLLQNIKTWRLATSDAHYLYQKFGFTPLAHPDKIMEKIIK